MRFFPETAAMVEAAEEILAECPLESLVEQQ
ncbi:hypothetical protein HNR44_003445 [Geomicrobium halophilum]|uniref:Uncharacterized protein n=1 Tax=Geomicrobium halophilum TaxID=549000 RepID=A0A841PUL3_9BACL|nr:hypothetical protein [Geomicrobium halophilum]